jgi:hypothetical protein
MAASIHLSELGYTLPDGRSLFDGLGLTFGPGRTGLVGRNGVGKTTLLKLISGELRPRSGRVSVSGRVAVLRQTLQVDPDATVADLFGVTDALAVLRRAEGGAATDAELNNADWTLESRMASALGRLGLDVPADTLLPSLSGGSGPGPGWPPSSSPSRTACCWTSRPTTSTGTAGKPSSRSSPDGGPVPSSSPTTASCSTRWTRSSN